MDLIFFLKICSIDYEIFQTSQNTSETTHTVCKRAKIIQLVALQIFQPFHEFVRDFIENLVMPRNGDILRKMVFPRTPVPTTKNMVYVSGRGVIIIGQLVEFENFQRCMV